MTLECADLHYRGAAMSQWVIHNSGQGQKFEVVDIPSPLYDPFAYWRCPSGSLTYWLPRQDYRLCEPPEQWVDVTERCKVNNYGTLVHINGEDHSINGVVMNVQEGYRFRKVERHIGLNCPIEWAFIVERKQP